MSKTNLTLMAIACGLFILLIFVQPSRAAIFFVTNTADSGIGSLRQAIVSANTNPGSDKIEFNIPKTDPGFQTGVWRIKLKTLLPSLTDDGTHILGGSQTLNQGNTNKYGPEVEIDGFWLTGLSWIISVKSNNNKIKEVAITFAPGSGIKLISGASGNIIELNHIGHGEYLGGNAPNSTGIEIFGAASNNLILKNLISNNKRHGVMIGGKGTNSNTIKNNIIGLNNVGYTEPNGLNGILIINGPSGNKFYENTISGNKNHGIHISNANNNSFTNNRIGVVKVSNGWKAVGNEQSGIMIEDGASGNWIASNMIAENHQHGILISDNETNYTKVYNNNIGPNGLHGVGIYGGARFNKIGDPLSSNKGNIIVGSGWSGVVIVGYGSDHNVIAHNGIGTDKDGNMTGKGNNFFGIHVLDGAHNDIFLNRIAFNGLTTAKAGVRIQGANAIDNTISKNSIYDNGWMGIQLLNGGNGGLAEPTITSASCTEVKGSACSGCIVEVFSDLGDEGRVYHGQTKANAVLPAFSYSGKMSGQMITVTATDGQGNTSEFSKPMYVGYCQ